MFQNLVEGIIVVGILSVLNILQNLQKILEIFIEKKVKMPYIYMYKAFCCSCGGMCGYNYRRFLASMAEIII